METGFCPKMTVHDAEECFRRPSHMKSKREGGGKKVTDRREKVRAVSLCFLPTVMGVVSDTVVFGMQRLLRGLPWTGSVRVK